MQGWIKLHRQLMEWEWYTDSNTKSVWLHLLLTANFVSGKRYCGFEIGCGQIATTTARLSAETGLSPQAVRTALEKLERSGEIKKKATNKFTLITLVKWAFYQSDSFNDNKPITNQQQTNNEPTTNQQQTNNKPTTSVKEECKNLRKKEFKNNTLSLPQKETQKTKKEKKPKNKFINYQQSEYDFEELERQERLLNQRWEEKWMEEHQVLLTDTGS